MPFSKVCVVGLGYIGLPTASVIASRGIEVIGVDVNQGVIDTVNRGEVHIVEPDLEQLVKSSVKSGLLRAAAKPVAADAFVLSVPTPISKSKSPDLSFVEAAVESIAPVLKSGDLIVLESTSPVGTSEAVSRQLASLRDDLSFPHQSDSADVALTYCPERVLPGNILRELIHNDRVVGGLTAKCAEKGVNFYKQFVTGECFARPVRLAELVKLAENAYRDVNIAYANELSLICDKLNVNVSDLIEVANRHPRVNILSPGPGVGGHCIAVDPWFIVHSAKEQSSLIQAARHVNDTKPQYILEQIKSAASKYSNPKVACFGLSYKANIDDLRESPAVTIVEGLLESGHDVLVCEPYVADLPLSLGQASLVDMEQAINEADVLVLLVDHNHFRPLTAEQAKGKTIIDTRGVWTNPLLTEQPMGDIISCLTENQS